MRLSSCFPLAPGLPADAWQALSPRLAFGVTLLGVGIWLSGSAVDHAWCLALQGSLSSRPTAWSLLSWSALGVCSLLLLTCLSDQHPRRVAAMLVAMVVGGLVVHALKRSLQVERPLAVFGPDHPVFQVIGEHLRKGSMPSGHTTTAWTIAGLMTLSQQANLDHATAVNRWLRLMMLGPWWVLAALQGLSRVVVGAHWPSDVIAGAGLGLCLAPLMWRLGLSQRLGAWLARDDVRPWVGGVLPVLAVLLCLIDLGSRLPVAWCVGVIALGAWGAWRWSHVRPPSLTRSSAA
jgi:undecaprenyl-diphosphatase